MATPTIVDEDVVTGNGGTVTFSNPAGTFNLLLALLYNETELAYFTKPNADWTEHADAEVTGNRAVHLQAFSRKWESGDPTSHAFAFSTSDYREGIMLAISGAASVSFIHDNQANSGSGSSDITIPGVTITASEPLQIAFAADWQWDPKSTPSGWTLQGSYGNTSYIFYRADTNTSTATITIANDNGWGALRIVIIPEQGSTLEISGSITPSGALTKQTSVFPVGSLTPGGALSAIKSFVQSVVGTITPSGSSGNQISTAVAGSVSPSGDSVKETAVTKTGSVAPSGTSSSTASFLRTLVGTITPSGTLQSIKSSLLSVDGSVTLTGLLTQQIGKTIGGTITATANAIKDVGSRASGAISPSGSLSAIKSFIMSLGGGITPSGAIQETISKLISGAVAPTGNLVQRVDRAFSGTITPSGAVTAVKSYVLSLAGSLTSSGNLQQNVSVLLSATVSVAGGLVNSLSVALTGTILPVGVVIPITSAFQFLSAKARGMWRGMRKGMN